MGRINGIWEELHLSSHLSSMPGTPVTKSHDEIQILTRKFDAMAIGIRLRDRQIEEHRHGLEGLVQQRTAALTARNGEMRLVLDTIDQGLVTLKMDGTLGAERSAIFDRWFPGGETRAPLWSRISPNDDFAADLKVAWEAVAEGALPLELTTEQLPKRIVRGRQHLSLAFHPIFGGEGQRPTGMLLVVSDITAQVEGLLLEAEQREFLQIFERVMRDKGGFVEFFEEASALADELACRPPEDDSVLVRKVHTLKGNAGIFGVRSIAELCHSLETRAAEAGVIAMREALPSLVSRWSAFAERVAPLIAKDDKGVQISPTDLDLIIQLAERQSPHAEIAMHVERLKWEPTQIRFCRVAEYVHVLATKFGKDVSVTIEDNGVRMSQERWAPFWGTFVHAVRNAVDHGIEPPDERGSKPREGRVMLRSEESPTGYVITISDDGRGIDWNAIRRRVAERGMNASADEDLRRYGSSFRMAP
jgi:two-component system chemotaxis sensor kinase CheA